jgi:hypothetical protein
MDQQEQQQPSRFNQKPPIRLPTLRNAGQDIIGKSKSQIIIEPTQPQSF